MTPTIPRVTNGDNEYPLDDEKKISGRKNRVILGYKATMLSYIMYTYLAFTNSVGQKMIYYFSSGHALAAGVAYIMISAAKNDRLNSDTYKRLNLCMLQYGLAGFFMVYVSKTAFPRSIIVFLPHVLAIINSIKGYSYGVLGLDKKKSPSHLLSDFVDGTKSTIKGTLLSIPNNVKSFGYLGAVAMVGTMKLAKLSELIQLIYNHSSVEIIASRLSRMARLAFMTMVFYTLKDAADRDRLEGTTFIQLNFLSAITMGAMTEYVGIQTRLGGLSAFFTMYCIFNGITSILKKKQKA